MYFHIPLLIFLLALSAPTDANIFTRSTESFVRIANTAHRRAVKRSSGLAQDLRRAFSGILVEPAQSNQKVYCVSTPDNSAGGLSSNSTGGGSSSASGSFSSSSTQPSGTAHGTASSSGTSSAPSATGSSSSGNAASSSPWKLAQSYQGNSFFNGWDFFTDSDPTHGTVQYVNQGIAQSANLTSINAAGNAIMRVDTTPQVSGNRQSVRITTSYTYTGGLVLLDSVHMPTGCGTWPAFWSNGPNWPAGGEIDIVEGVNTNTENQATIHTNPGCTLPSSNSQTLGISGTVTGGTNCAAAESNNAGCGIIATQSNTYGVGFNNNGGGVYAMQWVNSGISVYFFPRNAIPSDITSGAPQPSTWGTPMAFWPSSTCNPNTFFNSHSAIFDTTLCGDWAGNQWSGCAQSTGAATCSEYVQNNGGAFSEAYWEVSYVKIFQLAS